MNALASRITKMGRNSEGIIFLWLDWSSCHDNNLIQMFFFFSCFHSGPKLYKEPSAKSNKHIIQNALAHCCLAGKVNEGQKNKILEVSAWNF